MDIDLQQASRSLNAALTPPGAKGHICSVSIDTRTLQRGDCFIAIVGENHDGHDYVRAAIERGASSVIVSRDCGVAGAVPEIMAADTLRALGDLGRLMRETNARVPLAVIAGSSGKTTTKEMAAAMLRTRLDVLATRGNFNNLVGVPLMLFELQPSHQAALLELGMNTPGELRRLAEMTRPDCVALTNITNAHIGMFGSQEKLYDAKADVLRHSPDTATLVLNADDPLSCKAAAQHARGRHIIWYGRGDGAEVAARNVEPLRPYGYRFRLIAGTEEVAELHVFGQHNIMNALCAAAVARFYGLSCNETAEALTAFSPSGNRSEVEEVKGWFVIKDFYNASPAAVEQVLRSLKDFHVPGRRIALLADMLELGDFETELHAHIGSVAAASGLSQLFTLGERAAHIARAAAEAGVPAERLADADSAASRLKKELHPGDLLLIKGSRLMKLEKVYDLLKS